MAIVVSSVCILVNFSLLGADGRTVDTGKLPPSAAGKMDFVKDILPIFERSCIRCHNSNRRGQGGYYKVGFRLDVGRDPAMEREGVIGPGNSGKSRLIHNVAWLGDPMPPSEEDRLSANEIGKLRAWIDQGAVWHQYTPKLPEGYRLVNVYVKEEFPAEGGAQLWTAWVDKYERLGLKATLLVSERKGELFLSGGPLEPLEEKHGWLPYIPRTRERCACSLFGRLADTDEPGIAGPQDTPDG